MTVAHTESIRDVLGVHATALQSPTPQPQQSTAADSWEAIGSRPMGRAFLSPPFSRVVRLA